MTTAIHLGLVRHSIRQLFPIKKCVAIDCSRARVENPGQASHFAVHGRGEVIHKDSLISHTK